MTESGAPDSFWKDCGMAEPYSAREIAIVVECRALRHEAGLFEVSPSFGDQLVLALAMTTGLQGSRVACEPLTGQRLFRFDAGVWQTGSREQ
jgi:hypothetical protein